MSRARVHNILALVEALRERHYWLLGGPVRWEHLRKLLREMGIEAMKAPITDQAWVLGQPGAYVIMINSDLRGRRPTQVVLHELGHILLHMGAEHGVEKHLHPCKRGDPREAEAELFARLLYYGPASTPDNNPKIAEAMAAVGFRELAARPVKKEPEQLQLGIQRGAPRFKPRRVSQYEGPIGPMPQLEHGSMNFERQNEELRRIRRKKPRPIFGMSHESLVFDWSKDGKPLRFHHPTLGWVEVWDLMSIEEGGRRRIVRLKVGDSRTQRRVFVVSPTDRRRYVFEDRETRGRSHQQLIDQMRYAESIQPDEGPAPFARFKIVEES